jgi:hypothetical protein
LINWPIVEIFRGFLDKSTDFNQIFTQISHIFGSK